MVQIPNTPAEQAVTTPVAEQAVTTPVETKAAKKARKAAEKAAAEAANPPVEGAAPAEGTTPPKEPKVKDPNALTGREALALHYLVGSPRIGAELGARMGKGISRMMGCAVKAAGVSPGLVGRGFAVVRIVEAAGGKTRHEYHITDTGRTALAAAGDLTAAAAAGEAKAAGKAAEKVKAATTVPVDVPAETAQAAQAS